SDVCSSDLVEDGHPGPGFLIPVSFGHLIVTIDVGLIVRKKEIRVLIEKRIEQRMEESGISVGELAGIERIYRTAQSGDRFIKVAGIIAGGPSSADLFHGETKEEEILRADGFANLDVGAVERADGERPVQGELHVPGA